MQRDTIFMDRKTHYPKDIDSPKLVHRLTYKCNKNVNSIFGEFANIAKFM